MDLTEAEDTKKRWQEYTEELCKLLSEEKERKIWYFKKKILESRYCLEEVH